MICSWKKKKTASGVKIRAQNEARRRICSSLLNSGPGCIICPPRSWCLARGRRSWGRCNCARGCAPRSSCRPDGGLLSRKPASPGSHQLQKDSRGECGTTRQTWAGSSRGAAYTGSTSGRRWSPNQRRSESRRASRRNDWSARRWQSRTCRQCGERRPSGRASQPHRALLPKSERKCKISVWNLQIQVSASKKTVKNQRLRKWLVRLRIMTSEVSLLLPRPNYKPKRDRTRNCVNFILSSGIIIFPIQGLEIVRITERHAGQ